MFPLHPDDAHSSVQLRQSIVRQGMIAARRPGDLAALRERIGAMLIAAGQRIQGRQPSLPVRTPQRAMKPAH
jgi:hypothetical protein